jgi:hypothetical protein
MRITTLWSWRSVSMAVALVFLLATGCGRKQYSVRGKVSYPDGSPLTQGMVVFESTSQERPVMARGEIQADGRYELSTTQPGDGLPAGKYRVLVAPKTDPTAVDKRPTEPPFDPKFTEFATSELVCEVQEQANEYAITVTRPKKNR